MDMIYHAGTGTIINSAECLRVPMDVLAEYDDEQLDDPMTMQALVDENGTPLDGKIWLVAAGSPLASVIYGPFWTALDAKEWADRCVQGSWTIFNPENPDES